MRPGVSPSAVVIAVDDLSKAYGPLVALDRVSFSVRQGEILGLIGPNGAGKTTLFECLAGLLPADEGRVTVGGGARADRRSDVLFYLPDAIAPWPDQTVDWALRFTIGFLGGRGNLRDELVERLSLGSLLASACSPRSPYCSSTSRSKGWTCGRAARWRRRFAGTPRPAGRCSSRSTRSTTRAGSATDSCC
jgi:ABC-2 type transport system ATP-binding protein